MAEFVVFSCYSGPMPSKLVAFTLALVVILVGSVASAQAEPPAMTCTLFNYAAFADPANDQADGYMFSGFCGVNVAPAGKPPVTEVVETVVEGEWSPKLKRASEIVKFTRAGATTQFSTWANCDANPFLSGAPPACRAQGMGGTDFNLNIRREHAPLARGFVNPARVATLTAAAGSRSGMRSVGVIKSLEVVPLQPRVGETTTLRAVFEGGPAACPMVFEFGDGLTRNAITTEDPTSASVQYVYRASSTVKVTARALPGCSGSATRSITVRPAAVPMPEGKGELVAVAVGGYCTFSVNGASKGTSSQLKLFVPPGTYSVSCKTDKTPQKTRSVVIRLGETAMAMFKLD